VCEQTHLYFKQLDVRVGSFDFECAQAIVALLALYPVNVSEGARAQLFDNVVAAFEHGADRECRDVLCHVDAV
jgi:hypothetical protein